MIGGNEEEKNTCQKSIDITPLTSTLRKGGFLLTNITSRERNCSDILSVRRLYFVTYYFKIGKVRRKILVKKHALYSRYYDTYLLPVWICLWSMEQRTNSHASKYLQGN